MRAGLRARLFITVGAVIVLALAAVGLWSLRVAGRQLEAFQSLEAELELEEAPGDPVGLPGADRVQARLAGAGARGSGDPAAAAVPGTTYRDALAELADAWRPGARAVLLGVQGRVLGVSSAEMRDWRFQVRDDGSLVVEASSEAGGEDASVRAVLSGTAVEVPGADPSGASGTVWFLPPGVAPEADLVEAGFLQPLRRWLLGGVAVALVLALGATALLSRSILRPLSELRRAVIDMQAGDLSRRAPVDGDDEIADLAGSFNALADSLERNERSRRDLVADVAHELRTPLTGMRARLEAVQDGLLEPDAALVESLHREVLSLGRLVEDLQDLSLAEAGRLSLEPRAVDVAAEVRSTLEGLGPGPAVRLELPSLPAVRADAARFRQVLRNLLENAFAHSPADGTVRVAARRVDGAVEVTVADDGPGIDADDLPRVFDRFWRADRSRARATGGAGLGLAIVRELVEAQGGRVTASSRPGRGSDFSFTFPLAREEVRG